MDQLNFLTASQVRELAGKFGTPIYVYSESAILQTIANLQQFPNAYALQVRYAMKANPTRRILQLFNKSGVWIDASSEYEVERAILAGVPPEQILLTAQETARNLASLLDRGVKFTACSLEQIRRVGEIKPGATISLRVNPGLGSGSTNRTNVGGPGSSFGIWHEKMPEAADLVRSFGLKVERIHSHIGSGTDAEVWQRVSAMTIGHLRLFPEATICNLGGGFKVGRMPGEKTVDLQQIGAPIKQVFEDFACETGRKIKLEIEPGTYAMANSGCVIAELDAIADTGSEGYTFYKINSGMTELLRPSLYGAQHPMVVVAREEREAAATVEAIITGHCCESGDILTPAPGDPEGLKPRTVSHAQVGDYVVIEGAGAYGAGFSVANYNSFPQAAQVLVKLDGSFELIRRREVLEQIVQNEV